MEINPKAKKSDGLDIAAVVAKDGTRGHALLPEDVNRGKHSGFHRGKDLSVMMNYGKRWENSIPIHPFLSGLDVTSPMIDVVDSMVYFRRMG